MPNKLPLTSVVIGIREELMTRIIHWHEIGAISLVRLPVSAELQKESATPLPSLDTDTDSEYVSDHRKIDVILVESREQAQLEMARQRIDPDTLILDSNTFWVLELLVKQMLDLHQLSKDNHLFKTISMYSHEGIQFVDANGIVQYVNPSFSRITNIPPEERLGKSIYEVSPDGALVQALKRQAPVIGWKSTGHGSKVEAISNAAPIFVDGELIGAVTTFQDITEIKHLSWQLREREKQISHLHDHLRDVQAPHYTFSDLIGESESIRKTIETAKKAARTRSTVLITGESGTGKELFAHGIHAESEFSQKPFVVVNCAAIPAELLESELFGYEKGAFTHATKQKIGKFELANEGTIFLDEIGDMSPHLQAKLLRVLQAREVERVGGLQTIKVHVRVIAATNRYLQDMVREGKFREDLYYRLNVVRLEIPPLRKRIEDLPALVHVLMKRISRRTGLNPMTLTNKGVAMLAEYHWPGNIRELENFLERLMNESTSSVIPDTLVYQHIHKLTGPPVALQKELPLHPPDVPPRIIPLRVVERENIRNALAYYGYSLEGKQKAARALGISIATLYNKIRHYQLKENE